MKLIWNPETFPRTMTREKWREADRWRRLAQKELRGHEERIMKEISDLIVFGTSRPDILARAVERQINPPALMNPWGLPQP